MINSIDVQHDGSIYVTICNEGDEHAPIMATAIHFRNIEALQAFAEQLTEATNAVRFELSQVKK